MKKLLALSLCLLTMPAIIVADITPHEQSAFCLPYGVKAQKKDPYAVALWIYDIAVKRGINVKDITKSDIASMSLVNKTAAKRSLLQRIFRKKQFSKRTYQWLRVVVRANELFEASGIKFSPTIARLVIPYIIEKFAKDEIKKLLNDKSDILNNVKDAFNTADGFVSLFESVVR